MLHIAPIPELRIDGEWVVGRGSAYDVVDPTTEEPIGQLRQASAAQASSAVGAASRTFHDGSWSERSVRERAEALRRVADHLAADIDAIAESCVRELGQPYVGARNAVETSIDLWRGYANLVIDYPRSEDRRVDARRAARILREPVGVVLAITPWNSPLLLASLKIAPALASGCTVVLKPASEGPLTFGFLGRAIQKAGLPDGAVNIIFADPSVTAGMVADPRVNMVSFTGSSAVGSEVMRTAATNITRVLLELGGKSASVVLNDADPATVVPLLIGAAGLRLTGQVCSSRARILVPASRQNEWVDALAEAVSAQRVGDPRDPRTQVGPVATARQRARVEGYIRVGLEEGARLVVGGGRPVDQPYGWFVEPTLFDDVTPDMRIAREEIFGPVLTVTPYDDVDDAIRIANDSDYGLAGSVWTADIHAGYDVARRIRTGTFQINTVGRAIDQPTGGMKRSGLGREGGIEGLEAFFETRQIQVPVDTDLGAL
jgi:aldehyde dehydrogenase (NAD+)